MTPELARNALIFLSRVDIKGAEAPAFLQVMAAIERFATPQESQLPPPPPKLVANE